MGQNLTITIKTADRIWAGSGDTWGATPSDVTLTLYENADKTGANSGSIIINSNFSGSGDPFERGATDSFAITLADDLSKIETVELQVSDNTFISGGFDGFDDWYMESLSIVEDDGEASIPLFDIDYKRTVVKKEISGEDDVYSSLNDPKSPYLLVDNISSIELSNPLDELTQGDNAVIETQYGNVWFHVLDSEGERTPFSDHELNSDFPT